MNDYLTPEALSEIRDNINLSLANTFQMMFNLDISLLPRFPEPDGRVITSYVELAWKKAGSKPTKAYLTISVAYDVVNLICDKIEPDSPVHSPVLAQDVVCEITNIVANHVRTYLCDKMDFDVVFGLPIAGEPQQKSKDVQVLILNFNIKGNNNLIIDFSYAAPQDSPHN